MIAYHVVGPLPPVLTRTVFSKLARAFRNVPRIPKRGPWTVGVSFVTAKRIETLNRAYRGKNCPTDVLSFVADGGAWPKRGRGTPPSSSKLRRAGGRRGAEKELGDIVICTQVAVREAKRRKIDPAEELVRLLAHGTLHLAGMDHATEKEERRMFRLQEAVVENVMI